MSNTTETKKISFKSSKDFTELEIAELPKIVAKVCKVKTKKKGFYYQLKLAIYKTGSKIDRLVIVKPIQETLAMVIAKRLKKNFEENGEFTFAPNIRYSKGKSAEDGREYHAYDVWLCPGKRIFDFFTTDEMDYLNDYGFNLKFEEREYFDEDGYKYESLDF